MDYEAELGIIIGQPIHNPRLLAADAKNHIFGVVSLNDWTGKCSCYFRALNGKVKYITNSYFKHAIFNSAK